MRHTGQIKAVGHSGEAEPKIHQVAVGLRRGLGREIPHALNPTMGEVSINGPHVNPVGFRIARLKDGLPVLSEADDDARMDLESVESGTAGRTPLNPGCQLA